MSAPLIIRRRKLSALAVLLALALAVLYHYRLALVSDASIARKLGQAVAQAKGAEHARSIMERRYQVSDVGSGNPWGGGAHAVVSHRTRCFTVLVGEYRVLFVTSVEALVVFSPDGTFERVVVRRTVDAL
jgi:hypothetical protein